MKSCASLRLAGRRKTLFSGKIPGKLEPVKNEVAAIAAAVLLHGGQNMVLAGPARVGCIVHSKYRQYH
jgi:hypothetical protein